MVTASNGAEQYAYDPENLRVYKQASDGSAALYFYGAFGELLGVYGALPLSGGGHPYYVSGGPTRLCILTGS